VKPRHLTRRAPSDEAWGFFPPSEQSDPCTEDDIGKIKPLSDDEALERLQDNGNDLALIESAFGAFPEAGAAESRITLRLRARIFCLSGFSPSRMPSATAHVAREPR
jgi:hypothetical protein